MTLGSVTFSMKSKTTSVSCLTKSKHFIFKCSSGTTLQAWSSRSTTSALVLKTKLNAKYATLSYQCSKRPRVSKSTYDSQHTFYQWDTYGQDQQLFCMSHKLHQEHLVHSIYFQCRTVLLLRHIHGLLKYFHTSKMVQTRIHFARNRALKLPTNLVKANWVSSCLKIQIFINS